MQWGDCQPGMSSIALRSHPTEHLRSVEADLSRRHSDEIPLGTWIRSPLRGRALAADGADGVAWSVKMACLPWVVPVAGRRSSRAG